MIEPVRLSGVLLVTLVSASLISLLSFGVRAAFGLFTAPLPADLGISREAYSTAIAIQNLCWGATQPFAGYLTDRFGARRVIFGGAVLYCLGILGLLFATTPLEIWLTAGVMVGVGMGGASVTTALAAVGRAMPESHRTWALGIATAAASMGQFVIVPVVQVFVGGAGWQAGAGLMCAGIAIILVAAWLVRGDQPTGPAGGLAKVKIAAVLGAAFGHRDYVLLVLGFFVCGFQLAFITTHFPAYLADRGMSLSVAAWAIALVGLFNVVGSFLAGVLGTRYASRDLLTWIYMIRAAVTVGFLLLPVTPQSVLVFGAVMGLVWLSTVPLTNAVVVTFFGTRFIAMLFGIAFFSHQVGSFLGVYLAGNVYQRTGSYELVWWLAVALSLMAAALCVRIREQPSARFSQLRIA